MHLRVLDCNPDAPKTYRRPELNVAYRNNSQPEGLWLNMKVVGRLNPPHAHETRLQSDDDLVNFARDFYEELPYSVRHAEPFEGLFSVMDSGQAGVGLFVRRYVDLIFMEKMIYARNEDGFYKLVSKILQASAKASVPWNNADWTLVWRSHIIFQPDKGVPEWLTRYCIRQHVKLEMATAWPVLDYK